MSAGRGQLTVDAEGHVVRFYGGDRDLAEGIEARDMAVVVATRPRRLAFEAELRAAGAAAEDTRSFPGILEAARAARHFVTGVLLPRRDQALTQDAAIVTAELAANAVLHAGSAFTVAVSQSADGVRISVQDASPMRPADWHRPLMTSTDHGLGVVSAVANRWAVEPLPGGKVVWAELPASPKQAR